MECTRVHLINVMFQPQDQIEVGEDGFKQYDGKPGFL